MSQVPVFLIKAPCWFQAALSALSDVWAVAVENVTAFSDVFFLDVVIECSLISLVYYVV